MNTIEDKFHLGIKALIRNSSGRILLLKVNKEKLKGFQGEPYWDIPGGRIQKGSTVDETLIREVEEEIGAKEIKNIKPFSMVLSKIRIPQGDDSVGLILGAYTCEIPENSEIKLSEEHVEANWFTPLEVSKLLEVKYPIEFTEKIKAL